MKLPIRQPGRRAFMKGTAAMATLAATGLPALAHAYPADQPVPELVAQSPEHLWNAVTFTRGGRMFAGLPRWPGFTDTPSVVEILRDGSLRPYPGGGWNDWKRGRDATHAFVCVNTVHCFDGIHLWVVDTGSVPLEAALGQRGAQKLVKIDTRSDRVVQTYTFDDLLPGDASLNDLRIGGDTIYLTESGVGSIVTIDTRTGKMQRRLTGDKSTVADPSRPKLGRADKPMTLPDGKPQVTNADPIELSPGHRWLYYQAASGPLYRVATRDLLDTSLSEAALATKVQYVNDTPTLGGTAMDSHGNLFMAEANRPRISVLAPDGTLRVLLEDDRLWGGDALFITPDRYLYIPLSQVPDLQFVQGPGGQDHTTRPFKIYRVKLPTRYGGPIAA
ncbi:L-dopachrome tautomerase-related protein [Burkholderia gladioli]|uniref:L-dopachrome tautomerase-related protein n=1 Tax=Burkholderia gladioli TaxID=28095 RepID=UPI00163EA6C4|nr:L-dopachrome tautomerase-related protein [Burkholderia gladioli]